MQLRPQLVNLAQAHVGQVTTDLRFEIDVSVSAALFVRVQTCIALDRNGHPCVGFDTPHGIDQIAAVLSPQLKADLAPQNTGGKGPAVLTRSQILKINLCNLIRSIFTVSLSNRPRAGRVNREPVASQWRNDAVGDASRARSIRCNAGKDAFCATADDTKDDSIMIGTHALGKRTAPSKELMV